MRMFLDNLFDRRISILSFVENSLKPVTIKEISEHTGISKKTVSIIIKEFDVENSFEGSFKINYNNEVIQTVQTENLNLVKITSYYLKRSVLYQMVKYLFLYESLDVAKFCDSIFISPPTFSRYRKILKKNLSKCGLDLSRSNQLVGGELQIRNFFVLFFSNVSEEWEFSTGYYEKVYRYLSKNLPNWENYTFQEKKKIILIFFVTDIRSEQKKSLENPKLKRMTQEFAHSENIKIIFTYYSLNKKRKIEHTWNDTSLTAFFLYKERLLKEEINVTEYGNFFSNERFSYTKASEFLTARILTDFFDGDGNCNLYWKIRQEVDLFHLQLETCFVDTKLFYYIYDKTLSFQLDSFEEEIRQKILILLKDCFIHPASQNFYKDIPSFIKQDALVDYLYLMIYSLIINFTTTEVVPIKIIVKNSRIFVKDILKNKISSFFGDRVEFVNQIEFADMIVTDVNIPCGGKEIPKIYVSTFSDVSDLTLLIREITSLIMTNFTHRKIIKNTEVSKSAFHTIL